MSERIVVAMSGGVDSSLAAARLHAAGFDVIGVTLHLWDYPDDGTVKSRCCAPEDIHDARRVADFLGFPHFAFDRRELFQSEVVAPFVDSYVQGETPSPCVRCNRGVKSRELFALADRLGARRVATGHYARVVQSDGRHELHRGADTSKDQSYFLHLLEEAELARLMFPLGDSDKAEVRAEAQRLSLPGAHKGESQELCFVPAGRYDAFVAERAPDRVRPGAIVDEEGRELGQHRGIHGFTLGQRRNLGVATGQRAYVVGVDPATSTVRLGPKERLLSSGAVIEDARLASDVTTPFDAEVEVRYRGTPHPARVSSAGAGRFRVEFATPVSPVVRGQYAVFYRGTRVLGGGLIKETLPAAASEEMRA
jgi:tRNA-specific 2-thiouridylase